MNLTRRIFPLLLFLLCAVYLQAQDQYAWVQKASIPAIGRHRACGCSVGDRGYIGLGHINNNTGSIVYKDWWEYDPGTDSWMQKADFGGGNRYHAVAFNVGNYAYVGTGSTTSSDMDDFWKFDPAANTWVPIAPCPGGVRSGAVAFSINNLGYVALGDYQNDCWEYHPQTNTWVGKAPSPVSGYSSCAAVLNNKAYVGVGSGTSWAEFDPATNSWQMKAVFPGAYRLGSGCFAYNGWVYIVSGTDWSTEFPDAFAYNPLTNLWVQVSDFPGQSRHYFTCFTIGSRVYGGTGTSGTNYNDWWEYGSLSGINSSTEENGVSFFPNPVTDKAEFDFKNGLNKNAVFTLYDMGGKKIAESTITPCTFWIFNRGEINAGVYFYSIVSENKNLANGKIVIQ